jgi:hypothetical protein
MSEDEMTCLYVEIYKYKNIEGHLCKKINVKLR